MITIPNNDSFMNNRDDAIVEITAAMINKAPQINISLNREGPCADSLGLYKLLDTLCTKFNYSKHKIFITTSNLLESHSKYNIIIVPQIMYLNSAISHISQVGSTDKDFNNIKTFGNFIGHGNRLRIFLASYLYNNYQDKSLQTYHCQINEDYHHNFIGLEDLLRYNYGWQPFDDAVNLLKSCPITQDTIDTYPILNPTTLNITKLYPKFFVEIVNLTYFSGTTFYIDEKIWRPIIMKTPFIIQGPQNFINNFKKLGFKTFDQWWNEHYSEDNSEYQLVGITKIIDELATKTPAELKSMYEEMSSTLEHNLELLKTIKKEEFNVFRK